jgi:hypothetical protein
MGDQREKNLSGGIPVDQASGPRSAWRAVGGVHILPPLDPAWLQSDASIIDLAYGHVLRRVGSAYVEMTILDNSGVVCNHQAFSPINPEFAARHVRPVNNTPRWFEQPRIDDCLSRAPSLLIPVTAPPLVHRTRVFVDSP